MKLATRIALVVVGLLLLTVLLMLRAGATLSDGTVVALVVEVVVVVLASRWISRPVRDLAEAAGTMVVGAPPRLPRSDIGEVDTLMSALRRLSADAVEQAAALQQERSRLRATLDVMVEGVLVCDARGRITAANAAARHLLGYSADAPLPDLPVLFRHSGAREAVGRVLDGRDVDNCELVLDDSTVRLNARQLADEGAVLVLDDLTDVRRLETVRRDFVANVSHELKTPLTSIAGYADTLTDAALDPALRDRFVETIRVNARRMHALVDDLLDLSRLESGTWTPQPAPVDIAAAAVECWEPFADHAALRQVQFALHVDATAQTAFADRAALGQILTNLYDNALRYVPVGGHITTGSVAEQGGTRVWVQDDGCGIGVDHLPRIFERFYRVDPARARDEGGTGLGLAIVRHLVEAHGGWVRADSELQRGTTISCWFPA